MFRFPRIYIKTLARILSVTICRAWPEVPNILHKPTGHLAYSVHNLNGTRYVAHLAPLTAPKTKDQELWSITIAYSSPDSDGPGLAS